MTAPSSGKGAPNPGVAALLRSTTWKLLIVANLAATAVAVAGWFLTKSVLAFAPAVLVALFMYYTIFRAARRGAAAPSDETDPIVK